MKFYKHKNKLIQHTKPTITMLYEDDKRFLSIKENTKAVSVSFGDASQHLIDECVNDGETITQQAYGKALFNALNRITNEIELVKKELICENS